MVKPLGLTAKNQIAAPNNVFDAGWYTGSAKPGQPGAMLIDGHVSSWTAHGIFYNLKKLQPGDKLQIQRGDGTTFTYKVVKSRVYDAAQVDMKAALSPVTTGKPGLNLITCDGSVIKGTSEFDKRLVVFTEQL
jgi:LPXTG-site transpeptidase (sortase) family protein